MRIIKDGYKAAERCALSIVAQVKSACNGDLNKIKSCIKINWICKFNRYIYRFDLKSFHSV